MAEHVGHLSRLAIDMPGNDRLWFTIRELAASGEPKFYVERATVGSDRYDKIFAVLLTALTHDKRVLFDDENSIIRWILIYPN